MEITKATLNNWCVMESLKYRSMLLALVLLCMVKGDIIFANYSPTNYLMIVQTQSNKIESMNLLLKTMI